MRSTISVALCTRDGSRFIEEQLDSILRQLRPIDEIVISDDASGDDTVARARRTLAVATARVIIAQNPQALGVAANFGQALQMSTGDYVALSDQDDRWRPDRIARAAAVLDDDPKAMLVFSDARLVDAAGRPTGRTLWHSLRIGGRERRLLGRARAFEALLGRNLVTGATVLVRRELVASALPVPPGWLHDEWLAIVAALQGGLRVVPAQLIDYRQHGANEVGVVDPGGRALARRALRPISERAPALVLRAEQLKERLGALSDVVERERAVKLADGKVRHEVFRRDLPARRLRRLPGVASAWIAGRYRIFGRGTPDAARDLIRPA